MRQVVMCVYDLKARAYVTPFFVPTVAVGIRAFRNCAQDKTHAFGRNPADYALFELGVFDDDTATFACGTPVNHGLAAAFAGPTEVVEDVSAVKVGGTL